MTDTIKWSFSSDRCFRRCQRQYFLTQVAASHSAKDDIRREAFLCKQVKTIELWRGSLVHEGIEKFVVPEWQKKARINWDAVIEQTQSMAQRQFAFSSQRKYREAGMSKTKAGDHYCALTGHETESGVPTADLQSVLQTIEASFRNLAAMHDLLAEIERSTKLLCELPIYLRYDEASLEVHLDLLYFLDYGKPTIVDWKVSESMGGSDADLQTGLYAWAMCQHPKWQVTAAENCTLLEVQLLNGVVVRHKGDPTVFDEIENRIYRSVNGISALRDGRKYDLADIEDYDFTSNPNNCALCSQRALCQKIAEMERLGNLNDASRNSTRRAAKEKSRESYPQLF